MYSNIAFALTLLGVFSILENFRTNYKFSLLRFHMLAILICITISSFMDYLDLTGYLIPYYKEVTKFLGAGLLVNLFYVLVYSVENHRNINKETAISIIADTLIQQYADNETNANAVYLNKVLLIKGVLIDTVTNQQGNLTVTVGNPMSLSNVYITLNERPNYKLIINDSIQIKGVCTGLLSDVIFNEAQVINY